MSGRPPQSISTLWVLNISCPLWKALSSATNALAAFRVGGQAMGKTTGSSQNEPPAILPHDGSASRAFRLLSGMQMRPTRFCASWAFAQNQAGDALKRRPNLPLTTQTQTGNQRLVARFVQTLDIVKQTTALRYQLQKTATRMIIMLMVFEVFGKVGNTLGKNGYLNFRRTRIAFLGCIFLDKCLLALSSNRHRKPFLFGRKISRLGRDVVQRGPFTRSL